MERRFLRQQHEQRGGRVRVRNASTTTKVCARRDGRETQERQERHCDGGCRGLVRSSGRPIAPLGGPQWMRNLRLAAWGIHHKAHISFDLHDRESLSSRLCVASRPPRAGCRQRAFGDRLWARPDACARA
eukprot:scaffold10070_cov103-Phaeocystis_antarctica.AAC.3